MASQRFRYRIIHAHTNLRERERERKCHSADVGFPEMDRNCIEKVERPLTFSPFLSLLSSSWTCPSFTHPSVCDHVQCVSSMPNLCVLDVSNNRIRALRGLESSHSLLELWCNDNNIEDDCAELEHNLGAFRATLTTLYLGNNPAVRALICAVITSHIMATHGRLALLTADRRRRNDEHTHISVCLYRLPSLN